MGKLILLILGMLLMILNSKTAVVGARDGIQLCLQAVIPSIFPMMFLARLLTAQQWRTPKWLCRLLQLPYGSQAIYMAGILCGYPVGAQLIADAYHEGGLSHYDASRMLCICSNCGPAFLFGIALQLFDHTWMSWALWAVLLISGGITAWLIPGTPGNFRAKSIAQKNASQILLVSVKSMGIVCGWVTIFRVMLALLERWCISWIPQSYRILISGLLELSNGCLRLNELTNTGLQFILCALFMSLGGLCVLLQVKGVAPDIVLNFYFPGKVLQASISVLIAYIIQLFTFSGQEKVTLPLWGIGADVIISLICIYFLQKSKNSSRIFRKVGV